MDTVFVNQDNDGKEIDDSALEAAEDLAGLWLDHDDTISVDDTVRGMRRGRRFDTDAFIASTCKKYGETLCTANDKHYKAINGLMIDVFRPS